MILCCLCHHLSYKFLYFGYFNKFSKISGYKINSAQYEAMALGALNSTDVSENFPLKCSASGFS